MRHPSSGAPAGARLVRLARHVGEALLDRLYWAGWPARLLYPLGLQSQVQLQAAQLAVSAPAHLAPLRIIFAADFHAGPTTHPQLLRQAAQAIVTAQPDLVLLGGDFVSFHARYLDDLVPLLMQHQPRYGCLAVLGNHDYWVDHRSLCAQLAHHGVRVLINTQHQLPPPYAHISILGLDDPGEGRLPDPADLPAPNVVQLVLMHAPEGLRVLHAYPFTLALCGHTHGGQIAWPNGQGIFLPGSYSRAYPAGVFTLPGVPKRQVVVSRGIGCSTIPIRLFAPADLWLWILTPTGGDGPRRPPGDAHAP